MPEQEEPRLGQTVIDDLKRGDFTSSVSQDWQDLKEFYLDDSRRKELSEMGRFKAFFVMTWWIIKSMFLRLPPARRLLLLVSLFFFLIALPGGGNEANGPDRAFGLLIIAVIGLIFVLMLELKDKLLAKSELRAGRSVQTALMPETEPEIPGWTAWLFTRPANDVGGDLVDFIKLSETNFGLSIGDISGKGLGAALLMAKLQATLRAIVIENMPLEALGSKLNEIFYRDTMKNSFASLAYIELCTDKNKLRIMNAGHIPPIIIGEGELKELKKAAPALGIMAEANFQEQAAELEPGEIIFFFSDGLTEARDENGNFLGEERLKRILKKYSKLEPRRLGERIVDFIESFTGNSHYHDDLSMIILKRNGLSQEPRS